MQLLNLANYQNRDYRNILISCLLLLILVGDILSPSLNYIALNLAKDNQSFVNYASLANITPGLPFLLSAVIAYLINNTIFARLILVVFSLTMLLALFMLKLSVNNFIALSVMIVIIGFLYRTIYFSLDRQLCTIIGNKIYDFQSDLALFSSLFGAFSFKFSGYLYTKYQLSGVIVCFMLGNVLLYYFNRQIPAGLVVNPVYAREIIKPKQLISTLLAFPALLKYCIAILVIMFLGGGLNLLLMAKIHHAQIAITSYTSLISSSMLVNVVSALLSKSCWLRRWRRHRLIGVCALVSSLFILGQGLCSGIITFSVCYLVVSAISWVLFINMTSLLFQHIQLSDKLIEISPAINGIVASLYYLASLFGQLITTLLLNKWFHFQILYISVALGYVLMAIVIFRLHDQPQVSES